MEIKAFARSDSGLPRSFAIPNSVTMKSTSFLLVVTIAPGVRVGMILLTVPPLAVDGKAIKLMPPGDCVAPRT